MAKLFQQVSYAGHNLLTWAAACANTSAANLLPDHGGYAGFPDEYTIMCATAIQQVWRHHRWLLTRPPAGYNASRYAHFANDSAVLAAIPMGRHVYRYSGKERVKSLPGWYAVGGAGGASGAGTACYLDQPVHQAVHMPR